MNQLGLFDGDGDDPEDGLSLREAREQLFAVIAEGTTCPCCLRPAQRYRWNLYANAARLLIRLYQVGGTSEFTHSSVVKRGTQGSCSHLRFWALVESQKERRPDGGKSGFWRVTSGGEQFLHGGTIPKYAWVYDNVVNRVEGDPVTISDVLEEEFNFREHMGGDW
jgi:hypothetical protein